MVVELDVHSHFQNVARIDEQTHREPKQKLETELA